MNIFYYITEQLSASRVISYFSEYLINWTTKKVVLYNRKSIFPIYKKNIALCAIFLKFRFPM